MMMTKNDFRKHIKTLKAGYTAEQFRKSSDAVMTKVEKHPVFRKAQTVMAYHSMPDEVQTRSFIQKWAARKTILLPVVQGDDLVVKTFTGHNNLDEKGKYRILEPSGPVFTDIPSIDLVIVPGLAFDKDNNRLGRGKGYYDRFLKKCPAFKMGICFKFQYFENIPAGQNDVKMDEVIW